MCAGCIVVEKERVKNAQTDTNMHVHKHCAILLRPHRDLGFAGQVRAMPSNHFLPHVPYKCQKSSWGRRCLSLVFVKAELHRSTEEAEGRPILSL